MCYFDGMDVGLRELRQQASEIVRRVEAGETFNVTVNGRPAARLVPTDRNTWRRFGDLAALFAGPDDPAWASDRDALDATPRDPWARGL